MITLNMLFRVFTHDPQWRALAAKSRQPMTVVYLSKIGERDINTLTDAELQQQLILSDQPQEVKTKAEACMNYLREWANEQGKAFGNPEPKKPTVEKPVEKKPKPIRNKTYTKPELKTVYKRPEHADKVQDYADKNNIIIDSRHRGKPLTGSVYHDRASGGILNGKRIYKDCWRAEIIICGQRYRHRSKHREDCVAWLKAVKQGKIHPTDNKADWWRMEQRKDENVRIDEIIVSAAEESVLLYNFHQTGDITPINDYLEKRLLPHMAYYCAHTLNFGKVRTLTTSRQAAALLLTRITAGKPVTNFTSACKRMLRVHKEHGDFFYYERATEQVKLMVDGLNLDGLAEVWKITKDRRI